MVYVRLAFAVAVVIGADLLCLVQAGNECEVGYELFQESCYRLSDVTATRPDAAAACRPGHLVDITSEEEQHFIAGILTKNGVDDAWFGLLKSLSWSDGSSLEQEAWQNILADGGQRCFLLDLILFGYIWNDIGCDESYQSICEYENSDSENCRPGFEKFKSSCYQINHDQLNGTESAEACGAFHLVDITSLEENKFVVALLEDSGVENAWIGLTWSHPPSWSDGSLLMQASWYNIVSNGQSVCYRLYLQGSGMYRWDDAPSTSCQDSYRYICEYEAVMSMRSTTIATTNPAFVNLTGNPTRSQTGVIISLSPGMVAVVIIVVASVVVIIYFRRTEKHDENNLTDLKKTTTTQPSQQDPDLVPDYQNVSNPDKPTDSETYIGLDQTSRQPKTVYQGITDPNDLKSTDNYLSLDVNSLSKADAKYQSLNDNTMLGNKKTDQEVIYHEISENKADQYDYAYVNPTKVSIPAVNPNTEVRHTYFCDPNKNAKDVYVNANINVRKS